MPITLTTPTAQIKAEFNSQYDKRVRQAAIDTLMYVGESCVTEARNNGRYKDQTGNLRSSIGYVVVDNGRIVHQGASQKYLEGTQGETEGIKTARQVASDMSRGIALIVVAGMNYAVYVEARGLNVLSSAELLAESLTPQLLKAVGFKIL